MFSSSYGTCLRLLVFYAALCRSSAGRPAQASSSETSQAFLTLRATENRSVCRIQASVERVPDNTSGAADPLDRSGRDLPPHRSHRVNKPPHRSRYKASSEEAPFLTLNIESNNFQPTIPSLLSSEFRSPRCRRWAGLLGLICRRWPRRRDASMRTGGAPRRSKCRPHITPSGLAVRTRQTHVRRVRTDLLIEFAASADVHDEVHAHERVRDPGHAVGNKALQQVRALGQVVAEQALVPGGHRVRTDTGCAGG